MNKLSDNLPLGGKKGGKKNIREVDPETYHLLRLEAQRQEQGLELIASENAVSFAVMEAQGSIFTNKYAEGYPAKRFYGGCEYVDGIENLAINRAKKLFNASFANVQPHSGSQANAAVFMAELSPSESILGMDLSEGGHLTHGSSVNFSGKIFSAHFYATNHDTGYIDYDQVREKAKKHRPKLIIAGASSYPRIIDFAAFREIADEVGAALLVDMAHIAGLVAAGEHPSPLPHAHYVTTTTHKTLRGPRGGMILTNDEQRFKKINSLVFPGIQGGPLMHVIAAKAIAFKLAMEEEFRDYQKKVVENAQFLAESLKSHGFKIISGGTDNHLLLIDLSNKKITGKAYQIALDKALITINKNVIPNDPLSPFVTSGARVGTPTVTTRKMGTEQMKLIAQWMHLVAENPENEDLLQKIRQEVIALTQQFPLYGPSFTEID